MWSVNRSVLVVRPRQPYLDWVQSLDDADKKVTLDDLRRDCTALLVPEVDDEDHQDEIVAAMCKEVFEHELWAWMRNLAPQWRGFPPIGNVLYTVGRGDL
ncbi:MAG: hypothetical protein L0228_16535 [Planctomycetes bacterium]|nr:hypothetical protein [Planctomycetota bacterium]